MNAIDPNEIRDVVIERLGATLAHKTDDVVQAIVDELATFPIANIISYGTAISHPTAAAIAAAIYEDLEGVTLTPEQIDERYKLQWGTADEAIENGWIDYTHDEERDTFLVLKRDADRRWKR